MKRIHCCDPGINLQGNRCSYHFFQGVQLKNIRNMDINGSSLVKTSSFTLKCDGFFYPVLSLERKNFSSFLFPSQSITQLIFQFDAGKGYPKGVYDPIL